MSRMRSSFTILVRNCHDRQQSIWQPDRAHTQTHLLQKLWRVLLLSSTGLKQVMVANPDLVGEQAAFNWTAVEQVLSSSATRQAHAVLRFYVVYHGRDLEVPLYLYKAGLKLRTYTEDEYINNQSPFFGDALLVRAMKQFVRSLGKRYDGHKGIGFIQAGLLGFWGEWHSMGKGFLPDSVCREAEKWFADSFKKTKIQFRYPSDAVRDAGFGLHDDSFAFETLDGAANGGFERKFYFWNRVVDANMTNFWKRGAMGGETRVEIAHEVFDPTYQAGTFQKQDFMLAVNTTHATYMLQHSVFHQGGFIGAELANVRSAHARMGYNFYISSVSVKDSKLAPGSVAIGVTLMQIGVAPFYYDLNLTLQCSGMAKKSVGGAERLIEAGAFKVFEFVGIPSTFKCLRAISFSLDSSYSFTERPIKLAQGNGKVVLKLPLPNNATHSPTLAPTTQPTKAPASFAPTASALLATKLTLIDADTDADICPLTNGMILDLSKYPGVNIRADPSPAFGTRSVEFMYDGISVRIDNGEPYAFQRNSGGNYSSWTPNQGVHIVVATPYDDADATVTAGTPARISFTVIGTPPESTSKPVTVAKPIAPSPVAASPKAPVKAPATPPVIPPPKPQTKLTLINADTDLDIGPLITGMTINLFYYPSLNVRADPPSSFATRSVQFKYDGELGRTDNGEPYAFQRNIGLNYSSWTPTIGIHTILATPFTAPDANGTAGPIANVTFVVVRTPPQSSTKAPLPIPTARQTVAPVRPPSGPMVVNVPQRSPAKTPILAPTRNPAATKAPAFTTVPETKLTLIDADTDLDIGPLSSGRTINLFVYPNLNVRADPPFFFPTRSVQFKYDGVIGRTDNGEPYALQRNIGLNYLAWTPSIGVHTIEATPYTAPDANGTAGATVSVTFSVIMAPPLPTRLNTTGSNSTKSVPGSV
jgi:hypothetical protein